MSSINVFKNRNFKILWWGAFISLIGDQLTMIALPWLVLKITDDAITVGSVLSIIAVPRAIFILIGGYLTDRFNPKNILIWSRVSSAFLLLVLAFLICFKILTMPLLYLLVFLLGFASAFALPAGMTILPSILKVEELRAGNGVMMLGMQFSAIVGPVMAGLIISSLGEDTSTAVIHGFSGIVIVFLADAFTFFVSVRSLFLVKIEPVTTDFYKTNNMASETLVKSEDNLNNVNKTIQFSAKSIWKETIEGIHYLKSDPSLLVYLLYVAIISFFVVGPSSVGIPLVVEAKFAGTALEYGTFLAVQGIGMMMGILLATILPSLNGKYLGATIISLDSVSGICVLVFAYITTVQSAFIILFLVGMIGGYIQITAFTWIQTRVQPIYLGRMMSYLMFAILGLVPISSACSGFIIANYSVTNLYIIMGTMILAMSVISMFFSSIRKMGVIESKI